FPSPWSGCLHSRARPLHEQRTDEDTTAYGRKKVKSTTILPDNTGLYFPGMQGGMILLWDVWNRPVPGNPCRRPCRSSFRLPGCRSTTDPGCTFVFYSLI